MATAESDFQRPASAISSIGGLPTPTVGARGMVIVADVAVTGRASVETMVMVSSGSPVTVQDWEWHLTAGSNICEKKRKRVDEIRIAGFNGIVSRGRLTIGALPEKRSVLEW
jgi:hypothetical protein